MYSNSSGSCENWNGAVLPLIECINLFQNLRDCDQTRVGSRRALVRVMASLMCRWSSESVKALRRSYTTRWAQRVCELRCVAALSRRGSSSRKDVDCGGAGVAVCFARANAEVALASRGDELDAPVAECCPIHLPLRLSSPLVDETLVFAVTSTVAVSLRAANSFLATRASRRRMVLPLGDVVLRGKVVLSWYLVVCVEVVLWLWVCAVVYVQVVCRRRLVVCAVAASWCRVVVREVALS